VFRRCLCHDTLYSCPTIDDTIKGAVLNLLYVMATLVSVATETKISTFLDVIGVHSVPSSTTFALQKTIIAPLTVLAIKCVDAALDQCCRFATLVENAVALLVSFDDAWAHRREADSYTAVLISCASSHLRAVTHQPRQSP